MIQRFALTFLLLTSCAELSAQPSANTDIRALLIGGTWARHLDEKLFLPDGTYESHDRGHDQPTHGTWTLHRRVLSMTESGETTTHRILAITPTDLDMTFGTGSEGLHYHRYLERE